MKNAVAELQNRSDSTENWISNVKWQVGQLSYYTRAKNTVKKNKRHGNPGDLRYKMHSFRSR